MIAPRGGKLWTRKPAGCCLCSACWPLSAWRVKRLAEGRLENGHRPLTWQPAEHEDQLEAAGDAASVGKTLAPQPVAVPALPPLHPAVENLPREGSGIRKATSNPGGDRGQPPWGLWGARGSMPTPAANGERAGVPQKATCLADRALPPMVKLHPKRNSKFKSRQ